MVDLVEMLGRLHESTVGENEYCKSFVLFVAVALCLREYFHVESDCSTEVCKRCLIHCGSMVPFVRRFTMLECMDACLKW